MSVLRLHEVGSYLAFDEDECRAAGRMLAGRYQTADPFPHVVIEDFLDPNLLRRTLDAYPSVEGRSYLDRDQERLKYAFHPNETKSPLLRNLLGELNGQAFLGFLEEMTGIEGLVSDPYFIGGGLHETRRGGHLAVHADFNIHHKIKLERRLNLLIYLNEDWEADYGGALELWDRDMKQCVVDVLPTLGRAVIFATSLDSYHGHPEPLACPPDRSRRSIATYYYSAIMDGIEQVPDRGTSYRVRPGSGDRVDWSARRTHFIRDWVPPALRRIAKKLR